MTEHKSVFDYSFEEEIKPRRLSVLPTWFKVYVAAICLFSFISAWYSYKTIIYTIESPNFHTMFTIRLLVGDLVMGAMNLVGAVLIAREYRKAVLVFIYITVVKFCLHLYCIAELVRGPQPSVAFVFWPIFLHIPALLMLIRKRKEWEEAVTKNEVKY